MLKVLDSTEQPWDDDEEDNDDDDDTAPKKKSDYYGEEQEEYPRLRNGGAQGLFDYYQVCLMLHVCLLGIIHTTVTA